MNDSPLYLFKIAILHPLSFKSVDFYRASPVIVKSSKRERERSSKLLSRFLSVSGGRKIFHEKKWIHKLFILFLYKDSWKFFFHKKKVCVYISYYILRTFSLKIISTTFFFVFLSSFLLY